MRKGLVANNVPEALNNGTSVEIEEFYDAIIAKKCFEVHGDIKGGVKYPLQKSSEILSLQQLSTF